VHFEKEMGLTAKHDFESDLIGLDLTGLDPINV
jgi:hypothetical protein